MDMASSDAVRDELFKTNPTFRDLVHQHQNYEQRLTELAGLTYPNYDEQIEESIPIIVGPSGACRKATNLEASFLCHIFEFAPTQIAIEHVVAVSGHV